VQLDGLIGSRGVVPAAELLAVARERLGGDAILRLPTLLWLAPSDAGLRALAGLGIAASLLLVAGRLRRAALLAAWTSYLSLCAVGDVFLSYQWDALLLEALALGLFATARDARLARRGIWLPRLLLAKLMLLSGLVKLLSGDPAWRDGTALGFHWWTQPLPSWTSALAARLGPGADAFATFATLAIELGGSVALLGPRPVRLAACGAFVLLQLSIAATGSYGFFNLLTLALCLTLLDDDALRALAPTPVRTRLVSAHGGAAASAARRSLFLGAAGVALACSLLAGTRGLIPAGALRDAADAVLRPLAPLRTWNAYGLFAVMTKQRDEITLEGSPDGVAWRPYVFRWKPGPVESAPAFSTPHLPRLDWQMWFAALGACPEQRWLHALFVRLLEGAPDVEALFAGNPFPGAPPRALRATIAPYRFADAAARARGDFWLRGESRPYCAPVALVGGRLVLAEPD